MQRTRVWAQRWGDAADSSSGGTGEEEERISFSRLGPLLEIGLFHPDFLVKISKEKRLGGLVPVSGKKV